MVVFLMTNSIEDKYVLQYFMYDMLCLRQSFILGLACNIQTLPSLSLFLFENRHTFDDANAILDI